MSFKCYNFVCDRLIKDRAYPALASWTAEPYTAEWQQFNQHYPYTVPCELIEHCAEHGFPYRLYTVDEAYPSDSFYVIGLGFFDFDIDYFALLSDQVKSRVQAQELRILFYYHEGDSPLKIKQRIDDLCLTHSIPKSGYRFVTGNTAAGSNKDTIENFVYFPDHELLYQRRSLGTRPLTIHNKQRSRDFTCLSRTHKWWRAAVVADLKRNNLLTNSYWSYTTDITLSEDRTANPIATDSLNLTDYIDDFIIGAPYRADTLSSAAHNDHSQLTAEHYSDSWCNIVLETLYDADGSGGAFLTEKTFKCIKHGQPFIIVGAPGSLLGLQSIGYRTFDHAIDYTYDYTLDNTERWRLILKEIARIRRQDQQAWFESCRSDLEHNQRLFARNKRTRLNMLYLQLHNLL